MPYKNKEKQRLYMKQWVENNRERYNELVREYEQRNIESVRIRKNICGKKIYLYKSECKRLSNILLC